VHVSTFAFAQYTVIIEGAAWLRFSQNSPLVKNRNVSGKNPHRLSLK